MAYGRKFDMKISFSTVMQWIEPSVQCTTPHTPTIFMSLLADVYMKWCGTCWTGLVLALRSQGWNGALLSPEYSLQGGRWGNLSQPHLLGAVPAVTLWFGAPETSMLEAQGEEVALPSYLHREFKDTVSLWSVTWRSDLKIRNNEKALNSFSLCKLRTELLNLHSVCRRQQLS